EMVELGKGACGIDRRRHGVCEHASPSGRSDPPEGAIHRPAAPVKRNERFSLDEGSGFVGTSWSPNARLSPALAGHDPPSKAGFVFLGSRARALRSARLGG